MQQAVLFRRERQFEFVWFSRGFTNQREAYYFCANCLSTFECYSPADSADDADECSKLYYFAEKDSLSLCGLVGTSQISVRLIGLHCADCLSTLECYSPADPADYAEEYSKLHYFAEKDMLMWFMRLLLFGFCLRLSA